MNSSSLPINIFKEGNLLMKNRLFHVLCVLLAIPILFVSSVSAASSARSDTTGNFTVPQGRTYTFKITSSGKPTLVAGSSSFRYVSTAKSGNDYFIKFSAVGKAGDGCGFYLDGSKSPVAIASILADIPHSDTTGNFTVPQGKTYTFKITSSSKPTLVAGSSSFRYVSTKQSGSNYFIKFSAIGKAGDGCGFYLNGGKSPVAIATIIPTSKTTSLAFAEDDHTKAIFHIGMTADQVKQAITENQMQIVQNEYPSSSLISTDNGVDLLFVLGTDSLGMISINSVSDTQLYSPYETQKGLKIGDTVETVKKLYGEPVEQEKYGDDINGLGVAYYYDIPINLDDYYKKQTVKNKSERGVYLRINISQSKGNNFDKVVNMIYADKANY